MKVPEPIKKNNEIAESVFKSIKNTYELEFKSGTFSFFKVNPAGRALRYVYLVGWSLLEAPKNFINQLNIGLFNKKIIGYIYDIFVSPLRVLVKLVDPETYLNLVDGAFYFFNECLLNKIPIVRTLFNVLLKVSNKMLPAIKSVVRDFAYVKRLKRLELLQENIFKKISGKEFKFAKQVILSVIEPLNWLLLKGLDILARIFLKYFHPFVSCTNKSISKLKLPRLYLLWGKKLVQTGFYSALFAKMGSVAGLSTLAKIGMFAFSIYNIGFLISVLTLFSMFTLMGNVLQVYYAGFKGEKI